MVLRIVPIARINRERKRNIPPSFFFSFFFFTLSSYTSPNISLECCFRCGDASLAELFRRRREMHVAHLLVTLFSDISHACCVKLSLSLSLLLSSPDRQLPLGLLAE